MMAGVGTGINNTMIMAMKPAGMTMPRCLWREVKRGELKRPAPGCARARNVDRSEARHLTPPRSPRTRTACCNCSSDPFNVRVMQDRI